MAVTTKLTVFNDTLRELGSHPLANLTTANTRLSELNGAFDHAVEYMLSKMDWGFARRRATLTGVSDSGFPPFTYRYSKPVDYLRKCWVKLTADAAQQIDHAEVAAVFYGFEPTALIEYVSDHADNYDPANWPPHFTRCAVLYLAQLVAPKLARAGSGELGMLEGKLQSALSEAEGFEAVFLTNGQIPAARNTVLRRALEIVGQQMAGNVPLMAQSDYLRWQMNATWDTAVRFLLEQAPWSFAIRRQTLTGTTDLSGLPPYTYRYARPSGYLKRHWLRQSASAPFEADFAESGLSFYGYDPTLVLEFVSTDSVALDPTSWPAVFIETMALYLASQVAGRVNVATDDGGKATIEASQQRDALMQQFALYLDRAKGSEAVARYQASIPDNRLPVMRRALEFMGQELTGFVDIDGQAAKLRWAMTQAWDHSLKYVLEQGAWNFATRRVMLTGGSEPVPGDLSSDIIEGYSLPPATEPTPPGNLPDMAGYQYGYNLPADFLHKIWIKSDANHDLEIPHQFMRDAVYANHQPIVMEYVAWDADSTDPGEWSANFLEAMAAYLALTVSPEIVVGTDSKGRARLNANEIRQKLEMVWERKLSDAKLRDAIQQYPQRMPVGSFVRARMGSIGTSGMRRFH